MGEERVWALNTISGQVARIEPHILVHPLFKQHYVAVDPGTKSYEPSLWKPISADEYTSAPARKAADPKADSSEDKK